MGGALGLSMTDSHEKMTFFNDAFWKVSFTPKVGGLIALSSKPQRFSKLVVWVISYLPGKCTTVIVVNWAEIGRSMTDRKFRVQSSFFRSLCTVWHISLVTHACATCHTCHIYHCHVSLAIKSVIRGLLVFHFNKVRLLAEGKKPCTFPHVVIHTLKTWIMQDPYRTRTPEPLCEQLHLQLSSFWLLIGHPPPHSPLSSSISLTLIDCNYTAGAKKKS
jgi:hypothetical protein